MALTTFFVDLDDTLYPPSSGLWEMIRKRIDLYMDERLKIPREAIPALRRNLFETYGTTMRGLQATYQIDPADYLAFVHDVPVEECLLPDAELRLVLEQYPQQKIIFTNADQRHARRVLSALQVQDCFNDVVDIYNLAPSCKPQAEAFQIALQAAGEPDPHHCVLIDDSPRNIATARQMGFTTVLVGTGEAHPSAVHSIASIKNLPTILP
ncbi:MAG: pyrimidine 5'-nucleotidase [Chloroflexi bacterium]|nr:pyrimidine 5'-nucleotidase [Chloroflexota bacterium]